MSKLGIVLATLVVLIVAAAVWASSGQSATRQPPAPAASGTVNR